jgi:hypothetical protein
MVMVNEAKPPASRQTVPEEWNRLSQLQRHRERYAKRAQRISRATIWIVPGRLDIASNDTSIIKTEFADYLPA